MDMEYKKKKIILKINIFLRAFKKFFYIFTRIYNEYFCININNFFK